MLAAALFVPPAIPFPAEAPQRQCLAVKKTDRGEGGFALLDLLLGRQPLVVDAAHFAFFAPFAHVSFPPFGSPSLSPCGRGWHVAGEGTAVRVFAQKSRRPRPPHPASLARSLAPLPAGGEREKNPVLAARSAPEVCKPRRHYDKALLDSPPRKREAERRKAQVHWRRATQQTVAVCRAPQTSVRSLRTYLLRGSGLIGARSPSGAPRRLLPQRPNAPTQPRPCFTR